MENKLYQKTILWNGDSICSGNKTEEGRDNWADRIATLNHMHYKNYAVGGGTITENTRPRADGTPRHSVSSTLDLMYSEFPDADYIILEGGTNDADLLGAVINGTQAARFGKMEPEDYSGNYDRDTFCGALESIFYRATKYWKGKKIGFIVAQKMGLDRNSFLNRRAYFDQAIKICMKWGIPYLDLWNGSYLNPSLGWMYDPGKSPEENYKAGSFYKDGQHLTAAGYQFTADVIDSWLKTL